MTHIKEAQVLRSMIRHLKVRIAFIILKSDSRTIQRYLILSFIILLIPVMIYGWTQAHWSGALTGFVWVTLFRQLGLFALGFSKESRPATTSVGQLQRRFIWPFIIFALAGAYYGGWAWGWLWTPLIYSLPAIVFVIVGVRLKKNEKRRDFYKALVAIHENFETVPDISNTKAVTAEGRKAINGLLDFCESQQTLALVIAKHKATRSELSEQYLTLVTNGGNRAFEGCQLAALAFANASTLDYLLSSPTTTPNDKLTNIERFLMGGHLVYVTGQVETSYEEDRVTEAKFSEASTAQPMDNVVSSTGICESTKSKVSILRKLIDIFRWAYRRKQMANMASAGRFEELLKVATEAVALARESFGEDDVRTLQFLALAKKEHGDYSEALSALRSANQISQREWELLGKTQFAALEHGRIIIERAEGLRQASEIQLLMGDDKGAMQDLEHALELLGEQRRYIVVDPEVNMFRETCNIQCLELLGDVHRARGDFKRAEPVYRAALAARLNYFGENHGETALGYSCVASFLDQAGRFDASEDLHNYAIKILEIIPAFGEVHLPRALLARAAHQQDVGCMETAAQDLVRALDLMHSQNLEQSQDCMLANVRLGMVYAATLRTDEAFQSFTKALDQLDGFTSQVFAVSSERQRGAYLADIRAYIEIFASFVLQYLSHDEHAISILFGLLFKYKAIGPELLAQQRETILAQQKPEFAMKLSKLTRLRSAIAEIELRRRKKPVPSSMISRLQANREQLERDLALALPEMKDLYYKTPDSFGSHLPFGSALIDMFLGHTYNFAAIPGRGESRIGASRYMACILLHRQDDKVQLIDLGEAAPIDELIRLFRMSITGDDDAHRPQENRAESSMSNMLIRADRGSLHNTICDSVRHLKGRSRSTQQDGNLAGDALTKAMLLPLLVAVEDCRRLFIAPDGDLLRLPFEVLPLGVEKRLIDDDAWHLSYLSAGRDVLRFSNSSSALFATPLVVAAPDFDLCTTISSTMRDIPFPPLAGTQTEGTDISALLGVIPLLGPDALERRIKSYRSPRVLHIATHGYFLPQIRHPVNTGGIPVVSTIQDDLASLSSVDNPLLRSGLALAGANSWLGGLPVPDEAEDGLLTAEDVCAMDLRQTELVVLSACDTGLGESQFGEGVMGLRRAFMVAGAKTLVMSLWKVPDAATAKLMTSFYHLLLAGLPRAEAIRRSQQQLKELYPDPFYWGAFICQGDPGPL